MEIPRTAVMPTILRSLALGLVAAGCSASCGASPPTTRSEAPAQASSSAASATTDDDTHEGSPAAPPLEEGEAEAIFAGGCFWCMEAPFDELEGVHSTTSGYTGGPEQHPTYEEVSSGDTGHAEAVRVVFDPSRITYEQLLDVFWRNIDPTQDDGQFCDRGTQYRSAIFAANDEQRRLAEASKARVDGRLDDPIVTEIVAAQTFWVAEGYHQDFYRTNPVRYRTYRAGCGRDARLRELWGESSH